MFCNFTFDKQFLEDVGKETKRYFKTEYKI